MLSHETRPKDLQEKLDAYTKLVTEGIKVPLPPPVFKEKSIESSTSTHAYTATDVATVGLYYHAAGLLGFDVQAMINAENNGNM